MDEKCGQIFQQTKSKFLEATRGHLGARHAVPRALSKLSDDLTVPDSDDKRKHWSRALSRCFSDILRHSSTVRRCALHSFSAKSPRSSFSLSASAQWHHLPADELYR